MRRDFCTLFDSNYLPRGLALYESLKRVAPDARLRVFCMDERAERVLERLALPDLIVIPLAELERRDPELAATQSDRTQVEYCWTATPCVIKHCFDDDPELEFVTYVDADVFFFSSPEPLFAELASCSTQIVPHRYSAENAHFEETSGTYNVEWLTFRRNCDGLEALTWWRDRCIEWCYYRVEDGKLGDQKYLDDWPERFQGVSVLQHVGGGVAPWNVTNYRVHERDDLPWVDDVPVVFFHFHSLELLRSAAAHLSSAVPNGVQRVNGRGLLWTTSYPPAPEERRLLWEPYLAGIGRALDLVRSVEPGFDHGFVSTRSIAQRWTRGVLARAYHRAERVQLAVRGSRT